MTKAAVLWWGSFPHGQVTVGDYMSVVALCGELQRRGIEFDIIHRELEFGPPPVVTEFGAAHRPYSAAEAATYGAAIFVCGPLPTEWPEGRVRIAAFSNARRIAVGASLTREESRVQATQVFHEFFCRDGFERRWMDLSLACDWPLSDGEVRDGVAVCWRGHEGFYGDQCANEIVEAAGAAMLAAKQLTPAALSTDIVEGSPAVRELDAQFARFNAMLTTRLHGSLLNLRHRTPFIAIDQQHGGGKVSAMMRLAGWSLLASVESVSPSLLGRWLDAAMRQGWTDQHEATRERCVHMARETLKATADAVERALKR